MKSSIIIKTTFILIVLNLFHVQNKVSAQNVSGEFGYIQPKFKPQGDWKSNPLPGVGIQLGDGLEFSYYAGSVKATDETFPFGRTANAAFMHCGFNGPIRPFKKTAMKFIHFTMGFGGGAYGVADGIGIECSVKPGVIVDFTKNISLTLSCYFGYNYFGVDTTLGAYSRGFLSLEGLFALPSLTLRFNSDFQLGKLVKHIDIPAISEFVPERIDYTPEKIVHYDTTTVHYSAIAGHAAVEAIPSKEGYYENTTRRTGGAIHYNREAWNNVNGWHYETVVDPTYDTPVQVWHPGYPGRSAEPAYPGRPGYDRFFPAHTDTFPAHTEKYPAHTNYTPADSFDIYHKVNNNVLNLYPKILVGNFSDQKGATIAAGLGIAYRKSIFALDFEWMKGQVGYKLNGDDNSYHTYWDVDRKSLGIGINLMKFFNTEGDAGVFKVIIGDRIGFQSLTSHADSGIYIDPSGGGFQMQNFKNKYFGSCIYVSIEIGKLAINFDGVRYSPDKVDVYKSGIIIGISYFFPIA